MDAGGSCQKRNVGRTERSEFGKANPRVSCNQPRTWMHPFPRRLERYVAHVRNEGPRSRVNLLEDPPERKQGGEEPDARVLTLLNKADVPDQRQPLLGVAANVGGICVSAVVDSGAQVNLLTTAGAEKMQLEVPKETEMLGAAFGQSLK